MGGELATIIAAYIVWHPLKKEQVAEHIQHIITLQPVGNTYGKAFPRIFIYHRQHAYALATSQFVSDKIITPYMVWIEGLKADAGAIIQI